MEGKRLSHYEVLERLGGGGMGEVFKALDTRLDRHVALKFLPHALTRDDEARQRFVQEARAASALEHPNICTIHEIDATPEGQMFIAMAFYDGATLKKRIERGPLEVDDALDIAIQAARGLTKAHAAGIVHRDVKPANIMVTRDGFVKVVDFGIAKLLGVTGPTQAGSTLGTVSYMAPEQVAGEDAEPRTDVWALGVVFYEMLTGRLPFRGENQWSVMNAIANREPEPVRALRPEVPADIEQVVMAALEKSRGARTASAAELVRQLEACRAGPVTAAAVPPSPWQALRRPALAVPLVGVALAVGAWALLTTNRVSDERWAREEALPEMLALLDQDEYERAFALGEELERLIPNDPLLPEAWSRAAVVGPILTDPPGADVFVRPYGASDAAWEPLGRSPIESVRRPRATAIEIRAEAPGHDPRVVASGAPGFFFGRAEPAVIELRPTGDVPDEMVYVPGGEYAVRITGFNSMDRVHIDPFYIDRYEVTNAEYKEFVDAGGYERPEFWAGLTFVREGRPLSWEDAMAAFIDASGRPGPATWELGDFPNGQADYPVRGVSWYEAVAYNRFRDKALPTIHHWSRAAVEPHTLAAPLSTVMIPRANFGGEGTVPVGSTGAMGPYGTYDQAGNVREWQWNASGDHRWLLGGSFIDEPYMHSVRFTSPPFDRSPLHGFRGMRYLTDGPPAELSRPVDLLSQDYRNARAVSDEVFEVYRRQMAYVPAELSASVEETDDSQPDWSWERVVLEAGSDDQAMNLFLYLPKSASPPYQVLIYFPGIGPFQTRPARTSSQVFRPENDGYDYILRSGRAVVRPTWAGSYERWDDFLSLQGDQYLRRMGERVKEWADDLGRTIDYLETRDDIDVDRIAYWGASFGASTSLALLGLEERLRAALLALPGYTYRDLPPEADPVNYVPRVTLPALLIGGRYDFVFPVETSQRPLFDQLGTPAEHKRHVLYEMGHGPFPRGQLLRDILPWLDEYLGPVR